VTANSVGDSEVLPERLDPRWKTPGTALDRRAYDTHGSCQALAARQSHLPPREGALFSRFDLLA
jgi:hypothetical protein